MSWMSASYKYTGQIKENVLKITDGQIKMVDNLVEPKKDISIGT